MLYFNFECAGEFIKFFCTSLLTEPIPFELHARILFIEDIL